MLFAHTGYGRSRAGSGLLSLALHATAVALLFTVASNRQVQHSAQRAITLLAPLVEPYIPAAAPRHGGGGGGGDRSPLPASQGRLPRLARRQFTPPMAVMANPSPKLVMEPTLIVPPDAALPNVNMAVFGDPLARPGPPSNGTGSGGGIGNGSGGGVGPGTGPGFGPGKGGGFGDEMGGGSGGIKSAELLFKVEPEYSDDARKARVQGTVVLVVEIDEKGRIRNPRVRDGLGLGLDEKAMEAVLKWRFRPYLRNGTAIAGPALIEVNFRLL
jgi:TonB family protein